MTALDRRLAAFRPDLADARLRGEVIAERFVAGRPARISAPVADVLSAPRRDAGLDTQFLLGDDVLVFDEAGGFSWVQGEADGYVGYVLTDSIGPRAEGQTHRVAVPRTFVYSGADLRLPRAGVLSLGSTVAVSGEAETRGTHYALLADGTALIAKHLVPVGETASDWVAVAESLIGTPYLWGGVSGFGIDCSGLVQLSLRMAGRRVLRDTDMQQGSIGTPLEVGPDLSGLRRGDLVFWKGHVAIMQDETHIVHASGHTMQVFSEPLAAAVERISYLYGGPTGFRRV